MQKVEENHFCACGCCDEMLETLILNSSDDSICQKILLNVLTYPSYAEGLNDDYYKSIPAGKDNMSMILKKNRVIK